MAARNLHLGWINLMHVEQYLRVREIRQPGKSGRRKKRRIQLNAGRLGIPIVILKASTSRAHDAHGGQDDGVHVRMDTTNRGGSNGGR